MTTVELLTKAKRKLETGPWIKGDYEKVKPNGKTACCAAGALRFVVREAGGDIYGEGRREAERLLDQVARQRTRGKHSVIGFNDLKTTRKADVLNLFGSAIRAAKRA